MYINPYLHFNGRCDEAIEFYRSAVGAEVKMLLRFKESPVPTTPGMDEKVMHAELKIGESTVLLSDGRCTGVLNFDGFSLTIYAASVAESERIFAALGDGGKPLMPLAPTFFAQNFGMLSDRFGLMWMVLVQQK